MSPERPGSVRAEPDGVPALAARKVPVALCPARGLVRRLGDVRRGRNSSAAGGAGGKKGDAPLYSGPRDGRWPDYAAFSSDLVAQAITGLAGAVKTLSEGRLLVAVSYGYTLEFATRNDSGHLALARVLASPDIDILAGPNSYTGRGAGSPGAFGAPIDSVALHGKLWLVEDDTKTFLAADETPDTYNPKIAAARTRRPRTSVTSARR